MLCGRPSGQRVVHRAVMKGSDDAEGVGTGTRTKSAYSHNSPLAAMRPASPTPPAARPCRRCCGRRAAPVTPGCCHRGQASTRCSLPPPLLPHRLPEGSPACAASDWPLPPNDAAASCIRRCYHQRRSPLPATLRAAAAANGRGFAALPHSPLRGAPLPWLASGQGKNRVATQHL